MKRISNRVRRLRARFAARKQAAQDRYWANPPPVEPYREPEPSPFSLVFERVVCQNSLFVRVKP